MFKTTLADLDRRLNDENSLGILTLCGGLDEMLGKPGIPLRCITEFCGNSGTGKTQLCMLLCVTVQIPKAIGGLNGKAFFIDTRMGFNPRRFDDISKKVFHHLKNLTAGRTVVDETVFNFDISKNVYVRYVETPEQLLNSVRWIAEICTLCKDIKLIVIDSYGYLMKQVQCQYQQRSISYKILTKLQKISYNYDLAVVITNDFTTVIPKETGTNCKVRRMPQEYIEKNPLIKRSSQCLVPSLGESHSHKINQRITLAGTSIQKFIAELSKTLYLPTEIAEFNFKDIL